MVSDKTIGMALEVTNLYKQTSLEKYLNFTKKIYYYLKLYFAFIKRENKFATGIIYM